MSDLIRLSVPTMKCGGCVAAIEKALNNEPGLSNINVNLEAKTASFEGDVPASIPIAGLKAVGFEATELNVDE